jgi:hypothetical protein
MSDQRLVGFENREGPKIRTRPTLDGRAWGLTFVWNTRAQLWILQIDDATGVTIGAGIACVVSTDLLGGIGGLEGERPAGQLWIQDTSGRQGECGRYDLGRSHRVLYRPEATVAEAAGNITLELL